MNKSRLNLNHDNIRQEIKLVAWKQIAQTGVSALSLRSIAREMKITAPALYRYFASREHLVNALIRDAFDEYSQELEAARDSQPPEAHAGRLRAMCQAYRRWFSEHPQHFELLFNTPPPEDTFDREAALAADHTFTIMLEVLDGAAAAGAVQLAPAYSCHAAALNERYELLRTKGSPYSAEVIYAALSIWSMIHGLTALELAQQFSPILAEHSKEFVDLEIDRYLKSIGVESESQRD